MERIHSDNSRSRVVAKMLWSVRFTCATESTAARRSCAMRHGGQRAPLAGTSPGSAPAAAASSSPAPTTRTSPHRAPWVASPSPPLRQGSGRGGGRAGLPLRRQRRAVPPPLSGDRAQRHGVVRIRLVRGGGGGEDDLIAVRIHPFFSTEKK